MQTHHIEETFPSTPFTIVKTAMIKAMITTVAGKPTHSTYNTKEKKVASGGLPYDAPPKSPTLLLCCAFAW